MAKTPSKKSAKAPKKATTGTKKSKKRVESYSSYIYKVRGVLCFSIEYCMVCSKWNVPDLGNASIIRCIECSCIDAYSSPLDEYSEPPSLHHTSIF